MMKLDYLKRNAIGLSMASMAMIVAGCTSSIDEVSHVNMSETPAFKVDERSHTSQGLYRLQQARTVAFMQASIELKHAVSMSCLAQSEAIVAPWQQAMASWMGLQGQERGPQDALDQSWAVQFWPDKKNTLGRQMEDLLKNDPSISLQALKQSSVTVQGLGAIEWLLFDPAAQASSDELRCELMSTVADSTVATATTIATAWQVNPWFELSDQQWQQEMFALVNNQLDFMLKKLSLPLAKIGNPNPYFSESWRSQTSYANLYSNLKELQTTLNIPGGIIASLHAIESPVAARIDLSITQTIEQWPAKESMFESLPNKSGYRQALGAYNQLEYLDYLLTQEASQALGVTIGFNATDGD